MEKAKSYYKKKGDSTRAQSVLMISLRVEADVTMLMNINIYINGILMVSHSANGLNARKTSVWLRGRGARAPCKSTGTFARRPACSWRISHYFVFAEISRSRSALDRGGFRVIFPPTISRAPPSIGFAPNAPRASPYTCALGLCIRRANVAFYQMPGESSTARAPLRIFPFATPARSGVLGCFPRSMGANNNHRDASFWPFIVCLRVTGRETNLNLE